MVTKASTSSTSSTSSDKISLKWGTFAALILMLLTSGITLGGVLWKLDAVSVKTNKIYDTLQEFKQEQVKFRADAERTHTQLQGAISKGTEDRWKKANDLHFMTMFSALNNLKMPSHERITNGSKHGS